jgi:uncharacterized protein YggE
MLYTHEEAAMPPKVLMSKILLSTIILVTAAGLAFAQQPPPPLKQTLLQLSANGTVQTPPDQLIADLIAQSTSGSPAEAQRRVNVQMSRGMQDAKSTSGLEARALGYEVSSSDDKRTKWTARQTLELLGSDGPPLLDLTSKLQEQGFVTESLNWGLSPQAQRKAVAEATAAALKALQEQASAAAAALGLKVSYIKDVQIQSGGFRPIRPLDSMMAVSRASTPPPQATASPQDVSIDVSAQVVLER